MIENQKITFTQEDLENVFNHFVEDAHFDKSDNCLKTSYIRDGVTIVVYRQQESPDICILRCINMAQKDMTNMRKMED